MIQNIVKGRGFRGALDYALGKEGAERIGGTMAGRNARELAAEFRSLRALRPDVERAVFHASLSAPVGERLTNAQWEALADAYAERMGFGASAYLVVRHHDQAHEHVHVIASRVDVHGRVVSDAHDRYRGQEVLRALEREHGLTAVAPSWARGRAAEKQLSVYEVQQRRAELARYERTGERPFGDLVREHAPAAFREARGWDELAANLGAVGLEFVPKRGGLAVQDPATGETVKASAVGRECARSKLEQRFGVTYDEWDAARQQGRPVGGRAADRAEQPVERAAAERSPDGLPPARGTGPGAAERTAAPELVGADDPGGRGRGVERGGERGGRSGVGRDRAADRPGAGGPGGGAPGAGERAGDAHAAAERDADGAGRGDGRGAGRGRGAGEDHERAPAARGRDERAAGRAAGGLRGGGPGALADAVGVERDGGGVGVPGRAPGAGGAARDRTGGDVVAAPAGAGAAGRDGGLVGDDGRGDGALRPLAERLARDLAQVEALAEERQRLAVALAAAQDRAAAAERAHRALEGAHAGAVRAAERGYRAQLGAVYRDPAAAHRAVEARAQAAGWDVAVAELRAVPEHFGALHGRGAGDGVAGRVFGDDATRAQARAAVPGLAGWAAERHAARAAERQTLPELGGLAGTAAQAREAADALRSRREALPRETERLRAIGRELRGLARQLAPAELRQVEQLLTAPHRALLGRATALAKAAVKDALLGREREGMER